MSVDIQEAAGTGWIMIDVFREFFFKKKETTF